MCEQILWRVYVIASPAGLLRKREVAGRGNLSVTNHKLVVSEACTEHCRSAEPSQIVNRKSKIDLRFLPKITAPKPSCKMSLVQTITSAQKKLNLLYPCEATNNGQKYCLCVFLRLILLQD